MTVSRVKCLHCTCKYVQMHRKGSLTYTLDVHAETLHIFKIMSRCPAMVHNSDKLSSFAELLRFFCSLLSALLRTSSFSLKEGVFLLHNITDSSFIDLVGRSLFTAKTCVSATEHPWGAYGGNGEEWVKSSHILKAHSEAIENCV